MRSINNSTDNTTMLTTTPNLEAIRRVCHLYKVSICYFKVSETKEHIEIFADISSSNLNAYSQDLESWCGMKFVVYSQSQYPETNKIFENKGRKIYPLNFS